MERGRSVRPDFKVVLLDVARCGRDARAFSGAQCAAAVAWGVVCLPHVREVDGAHEPDAGKALDVIDQALEHPEAAWAADDPWVHGQHEGASVMVGALDGHRPDPLYVLRAGRAVYLSKERCIAEEGCVVQLPVDGDLHEASARRGDDVGHVVSHKAGVVEEATVDQQGERVLAQLPSRRPVPLHPFASDPLDGDKGGRITDHRAVEGQRLYPLKCQGKMSSR